MTKLIFLTVDGRARVENTRIGTRLIEEDRKSVV